MVEKDNFDKVERIIIKKIKKYRKGTKYYNGEGSGFQISHNSNLDSITSWLKNQPCIENAFWDKCEIKIALYPGNSTIGVLFKKHGYSIEKCYQIQEGTTGYIDFLGIKFRLFRPKNILVYKKSFDCDGFIKTQQIKCLESLKSSSNNQIKTNSLL